MTNFFKSFSPLLKRLRLKKYILEIVLLTVASVITITALFLYVNNGEQTVGVGLDRPSNDVTLPNKIFVDVSGAVKKPNIYQIVSGARLKEVINASGGLSDEADVVFFNRNFNLAKIVTDQEKIYIPSTAEINNGIFVQNQRTLDYTLPSETLAKDNLQSIETQSLININSSTVEELDQLPGVGQVTANKIIANRPYTILEDLSTKKVVNKSVFEKIKNLISL